MDTVDWAAHELEHANRIPFNHFAMMPIAELIDSIITSSCIAINLRMEFWIFTVVIIVGYCHRLQTIQSILI